MNNRFGYVPLVSVLLLILIRLGYRLAMSRIGWVVVGIVAAIAFLIVAFGSYYFEWTVTGYPARKPWD